ncbi:hypothetical protein [Ferruginivarius sediminum]|uniref:hypothetical protein n=1 Tax=Ferruginivarius sediminum TaxID=2661937 RepID=UPI00187BA86F|nr:hypothetical protein [Ferruginivarius sediminum]
MRRKLFRLLLACALGGGFAAPAAAQDNADSSLPPGEGRELVAGLCGACHSLRLVKQQGMSRERWDYTLDWMVEKQGMPELQPEMRTTILDYLAEHYGEKSRQDGGVSPFNRVQPLQPVE